jgi:hypothetical protein
VVYNGAYYIRVGEPNPGYPPGGSYWEIFDPSASPAFKLWVEIVTQANWNSASGPSVILNKPTLGTAAATDSTAYATAAQGTKADSASQPGHNHSLGDITVSGATNGQVAAWNGTAWVPSTPAASGVSSVAGRDGAVTLTVADIANAVGSVTTNIPNATPLTNMMQITSAGYSALGTNVSVNTLYIIVG